MGGPLRRVQIKANVHFDDTAITKRGWYLRCGVKFQQYGICLFVKSKEYENSCVRPLTMSFLTSYNNFNEEFIVKSSKFEFEVCLNIKVVPENQDMRSGIWEPY